MCPRMPETFGWGNEFVGVGRGRANLGRMGHKRRVGDAWAQTTCPPYVVKMHDAVSAGGGFRGAYFIMEVAYRRRLLTVDGPRRWLRVR